MAQKEKTYEQLQQELDEILSKIQNEDNGGNLTELLSLYEEGEKVIQQMQTHLEKAKNTIKKIQE